MNEVADELEIATGMEVIYEGPSQIFADRKIMFRILLNLARNAGIVGATEQAGRTLTGFFTAGGTARRGAPSRAWA